MNLYGLLTSGVKKGDRNYVRLIGVNGSQLEYQDHLPQEVTMLG